MKTLSVICSSTKKKINISSCGKIMFLKLAPPAEFLIFFYAGVLDAR